jgi:hypothetical protein
VYRIDGKSFGHRRRLAASAISERAHGPLLGGGRCVRGSGRGDHQQAATVSHTQRGPPHVRISRLVAMGPIDSTNGPTSLSAVCSSTWTMAGRRPGHPSSYRCSSHRTTVSSQSNSSDGSRPNHGGCSTRHVSLGVADRPSCRHHDGARISVTRPNSPAPLNIMFADLFGPAGDPQPRR